MKTVPLLRIIQGDCLDWLNHCDRYDMIFADPPDNVGLAYGQYIDNVPLTQYYLFLETVIRRSLERCRVFWISYYWRHDLEIKYITRNIVKSKAWNAKTFIWRYTFGQYNHRDCGSGFRYLLRLSSPAWKPDTTGIRVQSTRQALGDLRANPEGKVPDDVWEFDADGVWNYHRVTGNSEERRTWFPTQHPESLMERIVKLSGAKTVLDCFSGTGTTLRTCKKLSVACDAVEIDKYYAERSANELNKGEILCM